MPKLDLTRALRIKRAGGEIARLKGAGFSWARAPTWSPADLATAPMVWLDAADAATLTLSGDDVTAWGDKGSALVTWDQAAGGTPPTYAATGLNGRPALEFDGVADKFWSSGASVATLLGGTDFAVFVVGRADAIGTDAANGWTNEGFYGDRGGWVGMSLRSSGTANGYVYDVANKMAPVAYLDGANAVFHHEISGGQTRMRINGGAEASAATTGVGGGFGEQIAIGRVGSLDAFSLDGAISEVLILRPAPSAATRETIEGYLAHKWGLSDILPSDHPYRGVAP